MIKWYHPDLKQVPVYVWVCPEGKPCYQHSQDPISKNKPGTHAFKAQPMDQEILSTVSNVNRLRAKPFLLLSAVLQSINSKWFAMEFGIGYIAEIEGNPRIEIRNPQDEILGIAKSQPATILPISIDTVIPFSKGYTIRIRSNEAGTHGFLIYRNTTDKQPITTSPLLPDSGLCTYTDTLRSNVSTTYHARKIDLFGDTSSFGSPYTVPANLADNCNPAFTNVSRERNGTRLQWAIPCDKVSHYRLTRSKGNEHVFLYEGVATTYLDTVSVPGAYTYQVTLMNDNKVQGGGMTEWYVEDAKAPSAPLSIDAFSVTGKLTLKWAATKDTDVVGYHVYRTLDSNYTRLIRVNHMPISGLEFIQKFEEENSSTFYYCVQAEDRSGNRSKYSPLVRTQLPDVTPPNRPVLKPLAIRKQRTIIQWHRNPERDLKGYEISILGKKNTVLAILGADAMHFEVNDSLAGKRSFSIVAIDHSDNKSKASILENVMISQPPYTGTFTALKCKGRNKNKSIEIEWKFDSPQVMGYTILGTLSSISHQLIQNTHWAIEGLEPGQFEFKIKAIMKDGATVISKSCYCEIKG